MGGEGEFSEIWASWEAAGNRGCYWSVDCFMYVCIPKHTDESDTGWSPGATGGGAGEVGGKQDMNSEDLMKWDGGRLAD